MSKHYTKLLLLLILLPVWFFLSLALGSAEEPTELCQLCQNKALVKKSFNSLACGDVEQWYEFFDPNYIHHFHSEYATTLEQVALMYSYDLNSGYQQSPYPVVEDIIAEGDKVVVYVIRMGDMEDWFKEIWILRIANGQIVEGWSAQEVLGWGRPPVQPWPE